QWIAKEDQPDLGELGRYSGHHRPEHLHRHFFSIGRLLPSSKALIGILGPFIQLSKSSRAEWLLQFPGYRLIKTQAFLQRSENESGGKRNLMKPVKSVPGCAEPLYQTSRTGFTLIELLVVIAIIAILAAML